MNKTLRDLLLILGLYILALSSAALAADDPRFDEEPIGQMSDSDPLEPFNRHVWRTNSFIDEHLIEPLAYGYRRIPSGIRASAISVVRNLQEPFYLANNLLQADFTGAQHNLSRFVVNSTVGVAGLIDVASMEQIEENPEDIGQTLAVWGVGDSPYLVLPVIGPNNLRDTTGFVAGIFLNPFEYVVGDSGVQAPAVAIQVLNTREQLIEPIADMRANSLDFYATARDAYQQRRAAVIAQ